MVKFSIGLKVKVMLDVYLEVLYVGKIVFFGEVYKEKFFINLSIVFDV